MSWVSSVKPLTGLFLVFFLLASGDLYKIKLVEFVGPRLSRQSLTIQILNEIDQHMAGFCLYKFWPVRSLVLA